VSFGYVDIGDTRADLDRIGIPVKELSAGGGVAILEIGALDVSLCGGQVVDIWLDDLRQGPDCVLFHGSPVDRNAGREALETRIGTCVPGPPRHGGVFEKCEGGGLYLGHGMGDFLQIRVRAPGAPFDLGEECLGVSGKGDR